MSEVSSVMPDSQDRGLVAYFANNPIAGKLLMVVLILGGIYTVRNLEIWHYPDYQPYIVTISVPYIGASAKEVEDDVTRRLEESVLSVEGVDLVESASYEGHSLVSLHLKPFADREGVLADVKMAVERMAVFPPPDADEPEISLLNIPRRVLTVAVSSSTLSELELKRNAEAVQDQLLALPSVSIVNQVASKNREITIEVNEEELRKHDLSISDVSRQIRQESVNLSSGELRTETGGLVLRVNEKRVRGKDFEDIVVLSRPDGTILYLRDVATIRDSLADTYARALVEGVPTILLNVQRSVGEEALSIAKQVRKWIVGYETTPDVDVRIWLDNTYSLEGRLQILTSAGVMGISLVFLFLVIVFDIKTAVWVTVGVGTSYLGAFLLFPVFGLVISSAAIFALVVVIGIVVDDAVVIGESISSEIEEGKKGARAAIDGVRRVITPVAIGVITTMIAFVPVYFTQGSLQQLVEAIPVVVILVLLVSMVEAFLILPSHLASSSSWSRPPLTNVHARANQWLEKVRDRVIAPSISTVVRRPTITFGASAIFIIVAVVLVASGAVKMLFYTSIPGDSIKVNLEYPSGTPARVTETTAQRIVDAAHNVNDYVEDTPFRNISVVLGSHFEASRVVSLDVDISDTHLATVVARLESETERNNSIEELEQLWRALIGELPEGAQISMASGDLNIPAEVKYSIVHPDDDVVLAVTKEIREALERQSSLYGIDDSFDFGKHQVDFNLTDAGTAAGVSPRGLASQLRNRFFGSEVQRIQRGREEVKVIVRYPKERRNDLQHISDERLRRADGVEIPLAVVADIRESKEYASLHRVGGVRAGTVSARMDLEQTSVVEIQNWVENEIFPPLFEQHPNLQILPEGLERERTFFVNSLAITLPIAILVMYALIAIVFKSYLQPLVIFLGMPFAICGGIVGHWILGYDLTPISIFGFVAVGGVLVNDTLVLLWRYNEIRSQVDVPSVAAISAAARQRFRPILLTTLTTVVGLLPVLFLESESTRLFVPFAVSLVFGLMAASTAILFVVPVALYLGETVKERFASSSA